MSRWDLGARTANISGSLVAMLLVGWIVLGLILWRRRAAWPWWLGWSLIALLGAVLLGGTLSRGALAAFTIGVAVLTVVLPRGSGRWLPVAMLALVLTVFLNWPQGLRRVQALQEGVQYPGISMRAHLWRLGSVVAADHPLGVGADLRLHLGSLDSAPVHLAPRPHATFHWTLNDGIDIAARWGVLALMALAAAWTLALYQGWRLRAEPRGQALLAMGVTWAAAGMVSCVWCADGWFSGAAAVVLLGLAAWSWPAAWAGDGAWRRALLLGAGLGLGCWLLMWTWRQTSDIHHLERQAWTESSPKAWRSAPARGPIHGRLWWLPAPDDALIDTLALPLRSLTRAGWEVIACADPQVIAAHARPTDLVIAHGQSCRQLRLLPKTLARVFWQPDPQDLPAEMTFPAPTLLCWGQPDLRGHDEAIAQWCAARPGVQARTFRVGRLWLNRFPPIAAGVSEALQRLGDRSDGE